MVDSVNQQRLNVDALNVVRNLAGVEAAALASRSPLQRPGQTSQSIRVGTASNEPVEVRITSASQDFLSTVRGHLLEGRTPTASDSNEAVLVDETMAELLRRSGPVLGAEIRVTIRNLKVTGVVRDMVHERPDERHLPEIIRNLGEGSTLLVRVKDGASGVDGAILAALASIWGSDRARNAPVSIADEARRVRSFYTSQEVLLGALSVVILFALIAGVLTTVVLVLHQRRLDLSIRYALGAGRGEIRRVIWREVLLVVIGGGAIGLAGSWAAGRVMRRSWYDLTPSDYTATAGVIALLGVIVALAIEWPVRRFAYTSPFLAIKEE